MDKMTDRDNVCGNKEHSGQLGHIKWHKKACISCNLTVAMEIWIETLENNYRK